MVPVVASIDGVVTFSVAVISLPVIVSSAVILPP
jgi:hypothetical protein